jgi:hypothetical protein
MVSINYQRKVIFFHVPKTAGSYIQRNLGKYYGFKNFNDLSRFDTVLNNLDSLSRPELIFSTNPWSNRTIGINKYFSTSNKLIKMLNLNKEIWDNMYKFTFVRDPYSRFISSWNFVIKGFKDLKTILKPYTLDPNLNLSENIEKYKDIKYFIENKNNLTDIAYNHVFISQYQHILNEDNINNMDFIGKMENLEDDLEKVFKKIGINKIIHDIEKKVNQTEHESYKSYYDQELLNFVNETFYEDFENFNYKKYDTISDFLEE